MSVRGGLYTVNVDQSSAKHLTRDGGTLLLLEVPQGTVVGVDQQTHLVGPNFRGVKMLPPGPHMLAYSSVSREGDFSAFTTIFLFIESQQVIVREWSTEQELLLPLNDKDEEARFAEGVRRFDFDQGLAPYNLPAYKIWRALSCHIDKATVERLVPAGPAGFSITAEAAPSVSPGAVVGEVKLEEQLRRSHLGDESALGSQSSISEGFAQQEEGAAAPTQSLVGRCRFTKIPRFVKMSGMTASQLTSANLDKSALLDSLIEKEFAGQPDGLLAELQFAFLAFVVGQSLEGFQQWKALLHLLLGCEESPLQKRPEMFARLLAALKAQLEFGFGSADPVGSREASSQAAAPLGVPMVDELLADSFLKRLFCRFFDVLATAETPLDPNLKVASESLQITLQQSFGWEFKFSELTGEGSDDEYAPVVVDV